MNTEEKIALIKRNTEEIIGEEELKQLLESKEELKHYIGFEISGKPHLGHGLICMSKVKDLHDAGIKTSIFLADYHTWINNKLGGDMGVIQKIGVPFFKEVMIAAYKCVGGNPKDLTFVLGSELYHNNDKYWQTVIDVSKNITLARMQRSITIAGRKEGDAVNFAIMLYPAMQVADIFNQGINIAHAGNDQRKAQVIAREVANSMKYSPLLDKKGNKIKPVAIHGHLILGLQKPPVWPVPKENLQELWAQMKMTKSIPNSAIFMVDNEEEVKKKVMNAFCPEGEVEFNPLMDWAEYLVFNNEESSLEIKRPEKFGGNITYKSYENLKEDFKNKKLHPMDLKSAMAYKINQLLEPARKHFSQARVKKLLDEMNKLVITR